MKRNLVWTGAISAVLALALAGSAIASREKIVFGDFYLVDNGGISPSKLPRHESVPITAHLIGKIGSLDGSHPPALESVTVDVDRTIGIDARGLPTCRQSQLEARTTAAVRDVCATAIVGSGTAEVEVAFPEQSPFSAVGPVVLFNGGVHGRTTTVLIHAYVAVPAPTAIVTRATVTRIHRGRFGLRIEARVPRIAGGSGSVTGFQLKIGRRFAYRGREKSFLVASCPTGIWLTEGHALFDDGTRVGVRHPFSCTPG